MGRQETLGFVLIAAVLMAWMYFTSPQRQPQLATPHTIEQSTKDSTKKTDVSNKDISLSQADTKPSKTVPHPSDSLGKYFS